MAVEEGICFTLFERSSHVCILYFLFPFFFVFLFVSIVLIFEQSLMIYDSKYLHKNQSLSPHHHYTKN